METRILPSVITCPIFNYVTKTAQMFAVAAVAWPIEGPIALAIGAGRKESRAVMPLKWLVATTPTTANYTQSAARAADLHL